MNTNPQASMEADDAIAALAAVIELVAKHPEFARAVRFTTFHLPCDADELPDLVRKLGGHREKDTIGESWFSVSRDFGHGVALSVFAPRAEVCTPIVVGQRDVEVPDPGAPKITVTEPIIEWQCGSVLDAAVTA